MRWVCPHCSSQLNTPDLESGQRIAGPMAGWAYVRCFKCTSFAAIEISTARTVVVNEKPAPRAAPATPPPFNPQVKAQPEPQPPAPSAPPAARALDSHDSTFPAPLPELEEVPTAFDHHRGSKQIRAVMAIGAVMTALAVTVSYGTAWLARLHAPATTTAASTQIKRAQVAAKRMEVKVPASAPAFATDTPIPAAPLGAALTARAPVPAPREMRDSIQSSAMAPTRPIHDELAPLFLQARKQVRTMELRTGPGPTFPLLGYADIDERYPVVEWKDRWFKIQLEETPGLTAWVAYERVELFSEDKNIEEEAWR